jgi:hypothetical protein
LSKIPQNNKTRIPLIAAAVIIIVVAIAGNYYMSNIFSSSTGTPIKGVKLLQFTVTLTKGGVNNGTYTYYTKNVDEINSSYKWGRAANFMMRIEYTNTVGVTWITVFDASQQKAWLHSDGQWQDVTEGFAIHYSDRARQWLGYWNSLQAWKGIGDWTYNVNEVAVRIYDIKVNPSFSGSLFGPN